MINVQAELNDLANNEEEQLIGQTLLKNKWKYGLTAEELHMGWRKVSPVRKRLRHDLVVRLWKKYNLNPSDIGRASGIERRTAARILRPLGYQPKRDHKTERKRFLDNAYQELLQTKQPMPTELDDFIVSQQFNGVLNYAEAKERVYQAFPELAKFMRGKMTYLSPARQKELGVNVKLTHTTQARKAFVEGLKLDFPDTNVLQRSAILEGQPERVYHLRDLSESELAQIKAEFERGATVTQLTKKFDVSYKKMAKALKGLGIDLNSEQYKEHLREQRIANLPNPAKPEKGQPSQQSATENIQGKQVYMARIKKLLGTLSIRYDTDAQDIIPDYSLDFYLPDQKLAIDVSPIKDLLDGKEGHRSNTYHQNATRLCNAKGIMLITLFQKHLNEPTWSKVIKPALKRRILGHAEKTYYARQTVVKSIVKDKARVFLNEWHIDGYTPSRYAYGIYTKKNNKLLGVATFGLPQTPTYKGQGLLELKRLGWRADVQVRYGISKIMADVKQDLADEYSGLLTFSDNNIGQGKGYAKAGFKLLKNSKPQLTYVNPEHPEDHYSWSVATTWGARSGIIAQRLHPMNVDNREAKRVVREELPWRIGNGQGYVPQYDTGNKVWIKPWEK